MNRSWTTAILVVGGSGLLAAPSLLGGCTGDEFTAGAQGGGSPTSSPSSGDTTTTGDTSSTGASGGDCSAGCFADDGTCHPEQSAAFCGLGGVGCTACGDPAGECQEAFCDAGACAVRNLPNLTPCSNGGCLDGECRSDVEVCLNDADEDDDGDVGCSDQDCRTAGYGCADGAPGFAGPWLVIEGSTAADCPTGIQAEGVLYHVDLEADLQPGQQTLCGCAVDTECGVTLGKVLTAATCTTDPEDPIELVADEAACVPFEAASLTDALVVGEPFCTVVDEAPTPAAVEVTTYTMCPLRPHGCDANDGCAPPVPPASGDRQNLLCITVDGAAENASCPEGQGWLIQRAVSTSPDVTCACDCTLPDNACEGDITLWRNAECSECSEQNAEEPCQSVPVPPVSPNCWGALDTTYARYDRDDEIAILPTQTATFTAGVDRTLCCKPYPFAP